MEKELGWVHNLGRVESLGTSKVDQTVLARLMECQICQLCGSECGKLRKGTIAFAHPDARHFSLSQSATGALQAAILVLEVRGSESE